MCFGVACMSKLVSSKEKKLNSFLSNVYVQIPHFKEKQGCKIKSNMNVLEILNLDEKKSHIVQNYLLFPKQQAVTLCAFVLRVSLSMYLPQRMHCRVFSWEYMCEYHI